MGIRWKIGAASVIAILALALVLRRSAVRSFDISGAVVVADGDVRKQSPIAGVEVIAVEDDGTSTRATSDFSGFFHLKLPRSVVSGDGVTLQFRHHEYQPLDVSDTADDRRLRVVRLTPIHTLTEEPRPSTRAVVLSGVVVRYSVEADTATNIGSGVKPFEVINAANVPCNNHQPCSPDGQWKATVGGASLDAGEDNVFRNGRLSCIAGPCPFTHIESDGFSKGGRRISAIVRNWSDTTTFVLEAEVYRQQITTTVQRAYPFIVGRQLNFTLPPSAQGPSIEAELDDLKIIFPLGPQATLSWATCEVRPEKDQALAYRCDLKAGYVFKDAAE